MKPVLFILGVALWLLPFHVSAQYDADVDPDLVGVCENYQYGNIPDTNKYYFPVAQYVNVYRSPDVTSQVLYKPKSYADTLRVMAIMEDRPSRYKNIYGVWCKVAFPFNGRRYIGYVPSQFLSTLSIRDNDLIYLVALSGYSSNGFACSLKILKNYQFIHEYKFTPVCNSWYNPVETDTLNVGYEGYMNMRLKTNRGLTGIDRILEVYSGVDACGYQSGNNFLLIRDHKVVFQMKDGGLSEAGMYYGEVSYIFPADSLGMKNFVIEKDINWEQIDDSTSSEKEMTRWYKWNGQSLRQVDSSFKQSVTPILVDED